MPRDPPGEGAGEGAVLTGTAAGGRPRGGEARAPAGRSAAVLLLALVLAFLSPPGPAAAQDGAGPGGGAVGLEGGVYLFHHQPVDLEGADPNTEVYAAFATASWSRGRWRALLQARARDTKLRAFFPGNVWLQEGWVAFDALPGPGSGGDAAPTAPPRLTLRAGKVYLRLGRFWDGSFFGNVHYFDGLKLNPQFAVEVSGHLPLGGPPGGAGDGGSGEGGVVLGYTAQYILDSDRVSGAIPGRDLETLDGFRDRDGLGLRGTAAFPHGITLGASYLLRGVEEEGLAGEDRPVDAHHEIPHVALDAGWRWRGLTTYVEWSTRGDGDLPPRLRDDVPGSEAEWWLAGVRYDLGGLHLRYNFSRGEYDDAGRDDTIHQPGVTVDLARGVHGLVEVDLWESTTPEGEVTTDRSLNLVLLVEF